MPTLRPELGQTLRVRMLAPPTARTVLARYVNEGDASIVAGTVERTTEEGTWWQFDLPFDAPDFSYRFVLHGNGTASHMNGRGTTVHEPTDHDDFRMRTDLTTPSWALDCVMYHILIDRFARSSRPPTGSADTRFSAWSDPVEPSWPANEYQFFGGDLDGIRERIGHLSMLGVTAVALSPFFPSKENHRYSATSFQTVDERLGGDQALIRLVSAVHAAGIRCLGDLTLNHCGRQHQWFGLAQQRPDTPERAMFHFTRYPDAYATFQGVENLPKLNYAAPESRERMYGAPDSAALKWLAPPYELDGWRVDASNMVGRSGTLDLNHQVARELVAAVRGRKPDAFVFGENLGDPSRDIQEGGWPALLLESGTSRAIRRWCASPASDVSPPVHRFAGLDFYRAVQEFRAPIPWNALLASVGMVGSHDLPRLASVTGDGQRSAVAFFLLMTFPGIPMVWAGDEYGVAGRDADSGRGPMPWAGSGLHADHTLCRRVEALIRLRRDHRSLRHGGFRWLYAGDDAVAYERRHDDGAVLCVASRSSGSHAFHLGRSIVAADALLTENLQLTADGRRVVVSCTGPGYGAWVLRYRS